MFSKILIRQRVILGRLRSLSLALLLTLSYGAASFLLIAVATGALYFGLAANLRNFSQQLLVDELDVCRALVREHSGDSQALREEVEIDSAVRRYRKFFVRVLNDKGRAMFTTPGMDQELNAGLIAKKDAGQNGRMFWLESAGGVPYRAMVARVLRTPPAGEIWTIQIAVDLTQEREVLGKHRVLIWMVLAAAVLACPWIGFLIARRATGPLHEVDETARRISSTTLDERIQPEGFPAEIATLAKTFNAMLERLEEAFGRLSRFSADIAHELRTPVNNIRGQAEVALARPRATEDYREALVSCLEEAVRLSELIEALLFLARSESPGDHLRRTRFDVGVLLKDLRDYYDAAAGEAGVQLTVRGGDGIAGDFDRALLQRALGNLLSNALAHSSAGQTVELTGERAADGGIKVAIRDGGSGIPSEALPRIFDRFYRADPARTRSSGGTGLGLAIVQQIVSLHGGSVQVESEVGRGTLVSVLLPPSA
jgi:two-component system, OmpR family, heavy metal sensor histidine kinase CusS